MVQIEVDETVYSFLTKEAIPFVDKTPNDVLKRILKIREEHIKTGEPTKTITKKRKKPKTNLSELVSAGLLKNGQELFLHDYQGAKLDGYKAILINGLLFYKGQSFSMSDLAMKLLKENGYQSDSVRGPIFWFTENGKRIKDLWDIYLNNH